MDALSSSGRQGCDDPQTEPRSNRLASDTVMIGSACTKDTSTSTSIRSSRTASMTFVLQMLLFGLLVHTCIFAPSTWFVSAFSPKSNRHPKIGLKRVALLDTNDPDLLQREGRRRIQLISTALFASKTSKLADVETSTRTSKAKTKRTTKSQAKGQKAPPNDGDEAPLYWRVETDEFMLIDGSTNTFVMESSNSTNGSGKADTMVELDVNRKMLKFTVRGKPVPLRRHRTSRGFMYNPSAKSQLEFRKVVSEMIYPTDNDDAVLPIVYDDTTPVLFEEEEFLAVTILFRLRRPKSHFVGGKPGPGRLRPTSPGRLHPTRTDVDNLAKFVLDSLNELVYADDRQVISLHVAKVLDSEGHCEGATEITISRLEENEMESFVANMVG